MFSTVILGTKGLNGHILSTPDDVMVRVLTL